MPKPLNLLVLTDGEADDPDTLAYVSILPSFAAHQNVAHQNVDDIS